MIYLDYSATTPVSYDVLESYLKATKDFIGNPNSLHSLGIKSRTLMNSAIKQISDLFNVLDSEITFTSGATESNNMALVGTCLANMKTGNHIIVSKLEHPSIYKICEYLTTIGFEVSYVENDQDGLIDFEDLRKKIRPETILVSICAVNSEVGIRQPLKMIRQIIRKENPQTLFHSDMTQAIGKISVNLHDVDMASMSAHKIFGPKGIGLFYKNSRVKIIPLIHGSGKSNELKPGTPPLPLIVAFSKALRMALMDLDKREAFVRRLSDKILSEISKLDGIICNQTKYSIPYILNFSLQKVRPETLIHALEEFDIYIGTNTACASGDISTSILALYNDRRRAQSTIRISISYITTSDEVNRFLTYFKTVYTKLNHLMDEK